MLGVFFSKESMYVFLLIASLHAELVVLLKLAASTLSHVICLFLPGDLIMVGRGVTTVMRLRAWSGIVHCNQLSPSIGMGTI